MNKLIFAGIFLVITLTFTLVLPSAINAQYYDYNNYNYGNCTYHAYKLCVGNSIYWYSGCNQQQDFYQTCYNGQTCQYGQCTEYSIINPVLPPVQPVYNPYARTSCYNNSIHWYDSFGAISGLYKNCNDSNACTTDTCSSNACIHTPVLNCSENIPAQPAQPSYACGNGLCETTLAETNANCPADCKITPSSDLSISFFVKQGVEVPSGSPNQWQKTMQAGSNSTIYFMISIANNSVTQADNVNVSANIPSEILSLGNLQVNGTAVSGDIISGINVGSVSRTSAKTVSFEGKTQIISSNSAKSATSTINANGATKSDTVSINFAPSQAPATSAEVASAPAPSSGFSGFLKRWYLWILIAVVLIFLFVVVFKRFSSDV